MMREYRNDIVKDRINRGEFHAIPADLKSQNYFDRNPWPPKQFICGTCGFQYDGLVPKHNCHKAGEFVHDVLIYDFCTHCGDTFNQYDGRHTCEPYGRHARRVELPNSTTYYVRVFGFGGGRHHYEPNAKLQYLWVESLTGASGFRYVGKASGIERACLLLGLKPYDYMAKPRIGEAVIRIKPIVGPDIQALWAEFNATVRDYGKPTHVIVHDTLSDDPEFAHCGGTDLDPGYCFYHHCYEGDTIPVRNWQSKMKPRNFFDGNRSYTVRAEDCGSGCCNDDDDESGWGPCESCGGPHETSDC